MVAAIHRGAFSFVRIGLCSASGSQVFFCFGGLFLTGFSAIRKESFPVFCPDPEQSGVSGFEYGDKIKMKSKERRNCYGKESCC